MSTPLDTVSLVGAVVGTRGTVDWSNRTNQSAAPGAKPPHLFVFNESQCEIQFYFPSGNTPFLAAGNWMILDLDANDTSYTYLVQGVLTNPIISVLISIWYAPGETLPDIRGNGNSPLGGGLITGIANELQGVAQTLPVTELDTVNGPELLPASGVGTDLVLGALDNTATPQTIGIVDAANNRLLLPGSTSLAVGNGVSNTFARINESGTNAGVLAIRSAGAGANDLGQVFVCWNSAGSANTVVLSVGGQFSSAPTFFSKTGGIGSLAGQTTAGPLGVPAVVIQSIRQLVTGTTTQNIVFVPSVTGFYRFSLYFVYSNVTPQKVIANTSTFDPDIGGSAINYFTASNSAAPGMILNGAQASNTGNNQGVSCVPLVAVCQAGQVSGVQFRDPGGTPNDTVSVVIERLT